MIPVTYAASVSIGNYPEREGLKYISNKDAAILEKITEVIIPPDNAIGVSPADVDIIHKIDEFIGIMPPKGQSRIKLLLWTVEHVFPIRMLFFKKFTRLSLENRRRVLEKFDQSGGVAGRALIRGLKVLIQNAYYNQPAVAKNIGFVGRCE